MFGASVRPTETTRLHYSAAMPYPGTHHSFAIAVVVVALAGLTGTTTPASASPPPYDGLLSFPTIRGSSDPEEFIWQVQLGPDQELKELNDQNAGVFYEGGHQAFGITAEPAHDANGATVPTTLAVSEGDLVTLIVHHRTGNPAAGGAPFAYPILQGAGWEGGFWTVVVTGPPDEQKEREEREARERASQPTAEDGAAPPAHLDIRACGKVEGVALHAHGVTCRAARRVYRADKRGRMPEGWVCSASLARCYRGDFDSGRFMWWRRSVY
jgi:hypothetical protein